MTFVQAQKALRLRRPMQSHLLATDPAQALRTYAIVLDAGEEALTALTDFAARNAIYAAAFTAIGAFERATLGWFDFDRKDYDRTEVMEQCEGLSLIGDIAEDDKGAPSVHAHAVLGLKDATTRGGHFLSGIVHPTLEITLSQSPVHLRRRTIAGMGLALIKAPDGPACP